MWDLSDLAVDGSVQYFSRKQRCVATLQPVGDPGVPFLESIQLPPRLKRGEYPGVTATFVSCCFPTRALLPAPEWSRASAKIIRSCSAMCRGQRPPGRAVKCFVHSFWMIRKIEHKSSSPIPPLEDLLKQLSKDRPFLPHKPECSPFQQRGSKMLCKELCNPLWGECIQAVSPSGFVSSLAP